MCTMQKTICSPRYIRAALLLITCLLFIDISLCRAASQKDGAALYLKHCIHCHPEASTLKMSEALIDSLRTPPLGMPAYSEDKLSDADVQALGEYIRPAGRNVPLPTSAQTKPLSATVGTAPVSMVSAGASSGTERALGTGMRTKTKKPWNRGFARSWTIKGRQDGEVVTIQQFVISANADGSSECVVSNKLSDHSVKITAFEITNKTLKFELTWSWSLNSKYWKIETFDLRLSDDGKKLNGTHVLRTSGGHSATAAVWAE